MMALDHAAGDGHDHTKDHPKHPNVPDHGEFASIKDNFGAKSHINYIKN